MGCSRKATIEFKKACKNIIQDKFQTLIYRYNLRMARGEIIRSGKYNTINEYYHVKIANGNNLSERSESLGTQLGYTHEHEMKDVFETYGNNYGISLVDSKIRYTTNGKKIQADLTLNYEGVEYFVELKSYRITKSDGSFATKIQGASHTTEKARIYLFTGFDLDYNADFVNGEMAITDLCVALVDIDDPFESNRQKNNSRSKYTFSIDKYKDFYFLAGDAYMSKQAKKNFRTLGKFRMDKQDFPKLYKCSVDEFLK